MSYSNDTFYPSKQNLVTNIFSSRGFFPLTSEQAQMVYFWGGSGIYSPNFLGRITAMPYFPI